MALPIGLANADRDRSRLAVSIDSAVEIRHRHDAPRRAGYENLVRVSQLLGGDRAHFARKDELARKLNHRGASHSGLADRVGLHAPCLPNRVDMEAWALGDFTLTV